MACDRKKDLGSLFDGWKFYVNNHRFSLPMGNIYTKQIGKVMNKNQRNEYTYIYNYMCTTIYICIQKPSKGESLYQVCCLQQFFCQDDTHRSWMKLAGQGMMQTLPRAFCMWCEWFFPLSILKFISTGRHGLICCFNVQKKSQLQETPKDNTLKIQVCPKKGISPTILFWRWEFDHQSYNFSGGVWILRDTTYLDMIKMVEKKSQSLLKPKKTTIRITFTTTIKHNDHHHPPKK